MQVSFLLAYQYLKNKNMSLAVVAKLHQIRLKAVFNAAFVGNSAEKGFQLAEDIFENRNHGTEPFGDRRCHGCQQG